MIQYISGKIHSNPKKQRISKRKLDLNFIQTKATKNYFAMKGLALVT